jgi:hypothetical protein
MIAQQAPPLEARYHRLEVTNRWLLAIGAVILLALIALASWVAIDRFSVTGNAAKVDPWITAATGDSFADFQALYAPDAQILSPETNGVVMGYSDLETIFGDMNRSGLAIERTGAISTFGPFTTFDLSFKNDFGYEGTGVATFEYNDAGLITEEAVIIEY